MSLTPTEKTTEVLSRAAGVAVTKIGAAMFEAADQVDFGYRPRFARAYNHLIDAINELLAIVELSSGEPAPVDRPEKIPEAYLDSDLD